MSDQLMGDTQTFDPATLPDSSSNGRDGRKADRNGDSDSDIDGRLGGRRRRWPALVAGVAIGSVATIGAVSVVDRGANDEDAAALVEDVELNTVVVEQRDLIEEVEWSGTLAAGAAGVVSSPLSGTVTAVGQRGDVIGRGDVIARVDDQPIVALIGSAPMWRDLTVGDEGEDVQQLETNLAALGFDADGDVAIDQEYTSATADMVEAWQESLGVDETGDVATGDVVVLAGASTIVSFPAVGSSVQTGGELASVETAAIELDVVGWGDGDESSGLIDAIAPAGTTVEQGTVLYTADGLDTVAVVDVDPVTDAILDAFTTRDVEEIESVLAFLGFDPDGVMTIDDEADLTTVAAVVRWQDAVGLPPTGSTDPADYVVVPDDRTYAVDQVIAAVGDELDDGTLVMTLASPTLTLTADVAITEVDEFEIGETVTVEQVDESTFGAVVSAISDTTTESTDGGDPTVVVSFQVTDPPEAFISGTVTVTTESSRIDGATVVPTRALITLQEGGFAVEQVGDDGTTTLVGVEVGTFDEGVVEVTSGDIAPGDTVVVPT